MLLLAEESVFERRGKNFRKCGFDMRAIFPVVKQLMCLNTFRVFMLDKLCVNWFLVCKLNSWYVFSLILLIMRGVISSL